jgi:hypothetical protein
MVGLEVSKAHLDALAFIPRLKEAFGSSSPFSTASVTSVARCNRARPVDSAIPC